MNSQIIIHRNELKDKKIDLQGRDLVIGFSEPALRSDTKILGAPVNARLLSYFLPAVEIAKLQTGPRRPRLIIISGIKAAIKWNAKSDNERYVMTINNNLKKDFIEQALTNFFPDVFSLVEVRDTYDFLKIPEQKLNQLWLLFKKRYPQKVQDVEAHLNRFRPDTPDSENLFKYSLAHLFGLGDINFDWEPHNPNGYCSIGEQHELIFNEVREMAQALIEEVSELLFGKEIHFFDNMKIVIITDEKSPPPYNGAHKSKHGKQELDEVTYENKYPLTYYDERPRLKPYMMYIYSLVGKEAYESFWQNYASRYFKLKKSYEEAYQFDLQV